MNIDEMKTAWNAYDAKLQSTQLLSEKLINSIIKDRSSSRLFKLKRQYLFLLFIMVFSALVDLAILLGNPFDYSQVIEFVPIGIRFFCLIVLVFAMIRFIRGLGEIEISHESLVEAVNSVIKIVNEYEKPKRLLRLTLKLMLFSSVVLFPISFLPRKIESMGFWQGTIDTLIPIVIGITILMAATMMGAFKSRQGEKFQDDLKELRELKGLSAELSKEEST